MTSDILPSIYLGVKKDSTNLPLLHSLRVAGILIIASVDDTGVKPSFPQAFSNFILYDHGKDTNFIATVAQVRHYIEAIIAQDRASVFVYDNSEPLRAAFILAL